MDDIHGEYALRRQLESESNEATRKAVYSELHVQDGRLAELMLEKRKILIQREAHELSYEQRTLGFLGYGVEGINISQLNQWISELYRPVMKARMEVRKQLAGAYDHHQPWNRPYWDSQVNTLLHKDQMTIRFDKDILRKIALAWKLDIHFDVIQSKRGEMAYSPSPPEKVVATYGEAGLSLTCINDRPE